MISGVIGISKIFSKTLARNNRGKPSMFINKKHPNPLKDL